MASGKRLAVSIFMVLYCLTICTPMQAQTESKPHLFWAFIGSRTKTGIRLFKLDSNTGKLTDEGVAAPANEPGFFAISPDQKFLYACVKTEQAPIESAIQSFSINAKTGKLTPINQQPSGADEACFVSVDPSGRNVLSAHYNAAVVSVIPIGSGGKLSPRTTTIKQTGSSKDPVRQTHAYAHSINTDPAGKFAVVCDLGADKLFIYKLDADKGLLTPNDPPSVSVTPGSGPRHLTFHPNGKWVYVVTEMTSSVIGFNYDAEKGMLTEMDSVKMIPDDFKYTTTASEVQIDPTGRFLYATNRLALNLITAYSINQSTGKLTRISQQDTMGNVPRNFRIDPTGKYLLVGHQSSDSLMLFSINGQNGRLTHVPPPMNSPAPICVKFVAVEE